MNESLPTPRRVPVDDVLACITDRPRRVVLSVLRDRTAPISTDELATTTAATLAGKSLVDVTHEERDRVRLRLHHAHLPKLDEADLVEWDVDEGAVAGADHPAFGVESIRRMLDIDADGADAALEAIQPVRRRVALSVIESAVDIDREALARRVASREQAMQSAPDSDAADVLASLSHTHLPLLERAGIVEVDGETVSYVGHPELDADWFDIGPAVTAQPGREMPDTWAIEGRDDIVSRGQSLFERADEELFLLITTDGLLDEGCVSRLADALDRGVDVYLGTQSAGVRDLVREELPEVVIWEPQLDWMNLPPEREKVGRLVLADREAVLLGTLGEPISGGYREMALTGEGPDNTLVTLLRQLLGDRLDHLDAQSEDFLKQIPL
ncbi:DUF7344 domain-containing protein [Haloarcula laminariae]|uniref:DUF7344 domain-containing protein n=1 Tax=Haloarcula laminariae TaxID=2961577 RepID=UPI0024071D8D|nr:hypothetical protein [Halomicroarcula sp. FL173]